MKIILILTTLLLSGYSIAKDYELWIHFDSGVQHSDYHLLTTHTENNRLCDEIRILRDEQQKAFILNGYHYCVERRSE